MSFQDLMAQATRMTRAGDLGAAVEAIQQALAPSGTAAPTPRGEPVVAAGGPVIDVDARVVETPRDVPSAPDASSVTGRTAEQWSSGGFTHQARTVAYKLFVPARSPSAARPALVVMLHGCTQSAEDFALGTQMNALARDAGVVVLYPEQTQRANAQRCWNWFKTQHQQRDRGEPALLAALTRSVVQAQGIDPARVYVAGLSAGGAMADILGRTYPDVFAAVGVHSGLPHGSARDIGSALTAMRAGGHAPAQGSGTVPPLIVFHGDADATVNPSNGQALADAAVAAVAAVGGASRQGESTQGSSAKGGRYTRTCHADASGAIAVEHWRLQGAGHAWSGGSPQGSYTDPNGVSASAEMLRFFLDHRLP